MQKSIFSEWTEEKVIDIFNIKRTFKNEILENWLNLTKDVSITESERLILDIFKTKLWQHAHLWNEIELRERFIGPLIALADFTTDQFRAFAGKKLTGQLNKYQLSGEPDGMIASGNFTPKQPYFCLYEYKKEKESDDPVGQLLIAMLVAQSKNELHQPIYGSYVMERYWSFVVLDKTEYCVSMSFDAVKEDIYQIFRILRALKILIQRIVDKKQISIQI